MSDDDQVIDTIRRAEDGHESAAWFLIHQIETALRERCVSGPLFDYAANFFGELSDMRNQGRANPSDLTEAFRKLHLIRSRGQPRRSDEEKNALVARVLLLVDAKYAVDAALNALGAFRGISRSGYQAAYYSEPGKPGGLLKELADLGFAPRAGLETMAGVSQADLIRELKESGALR